MSNISDKSSEGPLNAESFGMTQRIEKIRKNKKMFKTPSPVQGLGTTWTNWVSSGIGVSFTEASDKAQDKNESND